MVTKIRCKNCQLQFNADDDRRVEQCPRCSSKHLEKTRELPLVVEGAAPAEKPAEGDAPRVYGSEGRVYGDTKDSWKSFHSTESRACPNCGGGQFQRDPRRKEKTCIKCGSVLPLARNR